MRALRGIKDIKFEYKTEKYYHFTGWSKKESAVSADIFEYNNKYYQIYASSLVGENLKTFTKIDTPLKKNGLFYVAWEALQLVPCTVTQVECYNKRVQKIREERS